MFRVLNSIKPFNIHSKALTASLTNCFHLNPRIDTQQYTLYDVSIYLFLSLSLSTPLSLSRSLSFLFSSYFHRNGIYLNLGYCNIVDTSWHHWFISKQIGAHRWRRNIHSHNVYQKILLFFTYSFCRLHRTCYKLIWMNSSYLPTKRKEKKRILIKNRMVIHLIR